MTITIHSVWIPLILTMVVLGIMFRPYVRQHDYDFGEFYRLFWLTPMVAVWAVYFGIMWWLSG